MNTEILTGLKNAVSRGQTIQSAVQSMVSAGYNSNEVQDAARYVNISSAPVQNPIKEEKLISQPVKRKMPKIFLVLIIILILLVVSLGLLSLFGNAILNSLFG
jgi:hypothetical protein